MPRRSTSAPYSLLTLNDFGRGLVLNRPAALLEPHEAQVAENVDLREGYVRRRSGYSEVGTVPAATAITGLFGRYDPSGDELLAMQGSSLLTSDGGNFSEVAALDVSIRSIGTEVTGTASTGAGIVVPLPDDVQRGDILFCHISIADSAKTITVPAGWTALGTDSSKRVFWRTYVQADFFDLTDPKNPVANNTPLTFKASATDATQAMIGRMVAVVGADPTAPINITAESNGTDSTPDVTGVTTTIDRCLVMVFLANHDPDVLTSTPPGTLSERYDFGSDPGTSAAATLATRTQTTAGATGTEIFTLSNTPTAWRALTVAVRPPSPGFRPTFAQALRSVYIATEDPDGAPLPLRKYDGSTVSVVTNAPNGRNVLFFKGAIWVAGGDEAESGRVWWSKQIPNQDTFPPNNYVDVTPGDGDRITGLATLHGGVIVLKQRSIAKITGYPPDDADEVDSDLQTSTHVEQHPGCIAPRSVASNNTLVVYLNREGIYGYNGTKALNLTEEVRPLFDTLNESELRNAVGAFIEEDHYILSVTTSLASEPNLVISVRLSPAVVVTTWRGYPKSDLGAGQTDHDLKVTAITRFPFDGNTYPVLGLKGKVVKMDGSFNDDADRILWTYRTGILPFGDAAGQKMVRRGWLSAAPGSGRVRLTPLPEFATEDVAGMDLDPSSVTTTGESAVTIRVPAWGKARRWAVEFSGEGDGPKPEIHELAVEWFATFRG